MTTRCLRLGSECRNASNYGGPDELIVRGLGASELRLFRCGSLQCSRGPHAQKGGNDPEMPSGSSLTIGLGKVEVEMWERISSIDIEDAKAQLSRKRGETLSRQAEEIKSVDTQLHDIESFERVVAAFFEEYMNSKVPSVPAASVPEQSVSLPERDKPSAEAPQNAPSLVLQIRQNILPNLSFYRALGD